MMKVLKAKPGYMSTGYFSTTTRKKIPKMSHPEHIQCFLAGEKNQQPPRDSSLEFIDAADDPELT